MKRFVSQVQRFAPETFYWEMFSEELKTTLSSAAFRAEPDVVLIDPLPLTMSAMNKLVGHASRAYTLLTSVNHERAALSLRENMRVPIWAHEAAKPDMEIDANDYFKDGDELPAGLVAIHIPGASAGETAFYTPKNGGIVFVGDALVNLDPDQGMAFLPDKYSADPKQSRQSLQKLLELDFEMMTFAHGQPIVRDAKKRLEALLESGGSQKFKAAEAE
jgi:glyoxylase-like metal-dependent hydrolase (beta-lactamase superfamily II)